MGIEKRNDSKGVMSSGRKGNKEREDIVRLGERAEVVGGRKGIPQ